MGRRALWAGIALAVALLGLTLLTQGRLLQAAPVPKAMLDTVISALSVVTAGAFFMRYRQDHDRRHLWCAYGFALVGASSLALAVSRAFGPTADVHALALAFTGRVVGGGFVAASAFVGRRRTAGLVATATGVVTSATLLFGASWVLADDVAVVVVRSDAPVMVLHQPVIPWALLASQLLAAGVLAVGAHAWARAGRTDGDELASWLAGALVLLLMARVYLLVYPGAPTGWFHVAELSRLVAHALALVAVARSVFARWRAIVVRAGWEERQRVAGSLHDGLAQELALLTSQSRWLARRSSDDELALVATIAQRALDESRRAIFTLRHGPDAVRVVDLPAASRPVMSLEPGAGRRPADDVPMAASS